MKYILYARKSTDTEDRQVLSLESQVNELKRLAEAQGIEITEILTESMSAKAPGRPVFNSMMTKILAGEADGIICWKIDRLTRNPVDGGQIQWLLQKGNIQCITTFEKTYSPQDNVLIMSIEQAMATQYIRDLSINVKRGNRAKLERGDWPNIAPYGYTNDRLKKTIKVVTKQANYVRRIFELYATGAYTLSEMVDLMYADGMRTPAGRKVYKSQIHKILNQKFYMGLMEFKGTVYQGKHHPIVSSKVFEQVQDVFHNRHHPKKEKHFYSARGFLTCDVCDCAITADTKKGHQYYYCTNAKGVCTDERKYMRSEHVDKLLSGLFAELQIDEETIDLAANAYWHRNQQDDTYVLKARESLLEELKSIETKESTLVDGYTSQLIKKPLFESKVKELENERVVLKNQLKEIDQKCPVTKSTFEQIKNVFKQGNTASKEYMEARDDAKRKLLEKLLSNVSVKGQSVASYKFKSQYQVLANTPKNASFHQLRRVRDSNPWSL
jgi:site-specific DNA recombinase